MNLNVNWKLFLSNDLNKINYTNLRILLKQEYEDKIIYPKYSDIFRAFNLILPSDVKVIIIGQDPYHKIYQANGLAFSVSPNVKIPPSLRNIYKELTDDMKCGLPINGDLTQWAKEGILLINSVLTVIEDNPNSHKNLGWEIFTDSIIRKLSLKYDNLVFILWGATSQKKCILIDKQKHLILKSPHPSPLSAYRGFFKSKPFSKTNQYLMKHNKKKINWCLTSQKTLL